MVFFSLSQREEWREESQSTDKFWNWISLIYSELTRIDADIFTVCIYLKKQKIRPHYIIHLLFISRNYLNNYVYIFGKVLLFYIMSFKDFDFKNWDEVYTYTQGEYNLKTENVCVWEILNRKICSFLSTHHLFYCKIYLFPLFDFSSSIFTSR